MKIKKINAHYNRDYFTNCYNLIYDGTCKCIHSDEDIKKKPLRMGCCWLAFCYLLSRTFHHLNYIWIGIVSMHSRKFAQRKIEENIYMYTANMPGCTAWPFLHYGKKSMRVLLCWSQLFTHCCWCWMVLRLRSPQSPTPLQFNGQEHTHMLCVPIQRGGHLFLFGCPVFWIQTNFRYAERGERREKRPTPMLFSVLSRCRLRDRNLTKCWIPILTMAVLFDVQMVFIMCCGLGS